MAEERDPRLTWNERGEPRSGRFGDVYYSAEDGLAESRAVFLKGCGLPDLWHGRSDVTVAELGFGTGLNIVALLDLWRRTRPAGGRLHIFSVEGFPLSPEEAGRALSAWPEIADIVATLLRQWPRTTPGFHRLSLPTLDATLDLAIGDAGWALDQWQGTADAWFLDGFAPSTNPEMWSDAVLDGVRARSAPGARLATFTVAGAVRRGLAERGFAVEKRPGYGRKRERLEARLPDLGLGGRRIPTVAVIGAGISGQAVARAVIAAGQVPVVLEASAPGAGASGFPAALVTPRLDAGDETIAALYAQALERAGQLYAGVPEAVAYRGVLQLGKADRDAIRFAKVAAQPWWDGDLEVLDAEAMSARCAMQTGDPALWMDSALVVRPEAIRDAWLSRVDLRRETVQRLTRTDGEWRVDCGYGRSIAFDTVIVCAGWGAAKVLPQIALSPVAGQADWVEGVVPPVALAWGGYAIPTGTGMLWGATHDRGVTDPVADPGASQRNLALLQSRLPGLAAAIADRPTQRRVAVRATTPDRLPMCGPVPGRPGMFVLGGLGSRGFSAAPLLGEHVAALALGLSSPLPRSLAARVDPGRRALGTARKGED